MPNQPRFLFFLADDRHPVDKNTPVWNKRLPMSPQAPPSAASDGSGITYGEYFEAVSHFLAAGQKRVAMAAGSILGCSVQCDTFTDAAIYLEKHGAFYHPSRLVVSVQDQKIPFVVNVAISIAGMSHLDQEVENLNRLNRMVPCSFLPKVYASGRVVVDEKRTVGLFMGDWFEAYAEFHISKAGEASPARLKVWDPDRGPYELADAQAAEIYQKAAEILTAYYAVDTCEQIFSWHHAAGDFIVKFDGSRIGLKLVTVRRYEQMMRSNANDAGTVIQALLIFLINMTLRMRIDRLDGVGELMWLAPYVVSASLRGFFKGIEAKERFGSLPKGFAGSFKTYLSRMSKLEWVDLVRAIAERLPIESSEHSLAMAHAETHAKQIYAALRRI